MNQKRELIRQIIQGNVSRGMFPEVFRATINWPDGIKDIEILPVRVPEESKKKLIRAVLTEALNEMDHPEIFEGIISVQINWPEGD